MPRRDKCDVCRFRKVKCDAGRPACDQCIKGGRPCTYSEPNEFGVSYANNSGLQLTSTRRASTGEGAFHTLTLRKPSLPTRAVTIDHPPSPSRPLCSDTTLLASRWTHMLEVDLHEDAPMSDFALILQTVRDRIGKDTVLDAAAKYTADSHHAFMARSESALSIAKRSGMEAMRALRFALARHSTDATDEMMLSMYIMTLSEAQYMGGIEDQNQRFHIVALCQILKTRMRAGRWSVFEQRLLRSISREETLEAVVSGTDSVLDDPLSTAPALSMEDEDCENSDILNALMDQSIVLPRLSRLLRQTLQEPENNELVSQTVSLATQLYNSLQPLQIEAFIHSNTWTLDRGTIAEDQPSIPPELGPPVDYPSVPAKTIPMRSHMNRLIIYLVITKLLKILPHLTTVFDPTLVETNILASASFITRSIPHALRPGPGPGPPWKAMRISAPLTMAYGAWSHLETKGHENAAAMREYCGEGFRTLAKLWRWGVGVEILGRYCEAWTGGATMRSVSRKKGVSDVEGC